MSVTHESADPQNSLHHSIPAQQQQYFYPPGHYPNYAAHNNIGNYPSFGGQDHYTGELVYSYRGHQNFHHRPRGLGYRGQRARSQYQGQQTEQHGASGSLNCGVSAEMSSKHRARPKQSYQAQRAERAQRGSSHYPGPRRDYTLKPDVQSENITVQLNANAQPFYGSYGYSNRGSGWNQEPQISQAERKQTPASPYVPEPSARTGTAPEAKSVVQERSFKRQGQKGPSRALRQRPQGKKSEADGETQRGSLIEQLTNNSYECMVCCDIVRREAAVWSCNNCYHVFHLCCIKKWARSPTATVEGEGQGWRCPACQNVTEKVPNQYRCFCGKVRDPDWNRFETPHSCAEVCGKKRSGNCQHRCNVLCHPGPCPPCHATVNKTCNCGKTKMTVPCGQSSTLKCTAQCQKVLNCGKHECADICHSEQCQPCDVKIQQVCYCGRETREVVCGAAESFHTSFSCQKTCDRPLDCGNHKCERLCHPGLCDGCKLLPLTVTHCPCGRTPLAELTKPGTERKQCTDPLPTCDQVCGKLLGCGPDADPHSCSLKCHESECIPCTGETPVTCRCGANISLIRCVDAKQYTESNPFRCERRCHKKKTCGRHKCSQLCCVDKEHKCNFVCGRKLTCGLHRCEEPCHRGNCPTCWRVIFEEVRCHCGETFLEPPIACGTQPPECANTCTREHPCGHPVRHKCHSDDRCPPCTQLTKKWCMGQHEERTNIPCHVTEISCGLTCNKPLPCGQHRCQKLCHKGDCVEGEEHCKQPCTLPREGCSHKCGAPCHGDTPCPITACRAQVLIKCECGNRTEKTVCMQGAVDMQRLETSVLAMEISRAQSGQCVDLTSLNKRKEKKLECNSECAVMDRNRRLALALEIKNPDLTGKLGTPAYTQFLKDYAKQNLNFVAEVERSLSNLVHMAEESKQAKRSHAFQPMNRDQRRTIHELAEFYGCETISYDQEPRKNVVATAYRSKCWHPSLKLTALVLREMNKPMKAPVPVFSTSSTEKDRRSAVSAKTPEMKSAWTALGSASSRKTATSGSSSTTGTISTENHEAGSEIDYFDMTD